MEAGLFTVAEFARRYGVDDEVVRRWVRRGDIPYTLVGPRKMKMIAPAEVFTQITPAHPDMEAAIRTLEQRDGLEHKTALSVVSGLHTEEITELAQWTPTETKKIEKEVLEAPSEHEKQLSYPYGYDGGGQKRGTERDTFAVGPTAPNPQIAGRSGRTVGNTGQPQKRR